MKIAVLDDYQHAASRFADWDAALPDAEIDFVHEHLDGEDLFARIAACDVVAAMRERTPFPAVAFDWLPALRLLVTTGMQNASFDLAAAAAHGVTVCGTRGWGPATTELPWALILGLVRGVAADDAAIRAGGWQTTVGGDLSGTTLGVVGVGRLGGAVARIGQAFGMQTIAWSPNLTDQRAAEQGVVRVDRDELFARADVVSVHLVLSERTRGLIGEADLRAMKRTAYLVNTSRGPLIEESALRAAVEGGWLAGVGLDVYDVEPLPAEHWLRTAPRTLLSPHMGYVSEAGYRVFFADVLEDITAFAAGTPVRVLGRG